MCSARSGSDSSNPDDRRAGAGVAAPPTLAALLALAVRRAATILAIAVAVLLAVIGGWTLWPAKYTAVALVAIDPQAPRLISDRDATVVAGDASAVQSYAEVATSDGFLVQLAEREKLLDDPEFTEGAGGAVAVAAEIRRNLKVTRRGLTYLIDISFTSKDSQKAARIANAVAAEIVQRQQALHRGATGGISDALRSRLIDLRATVLASEKAVADYRQENGLLDTAPDGSLGLKRLNSLADQLGPLRSRLEDARARYDRLRRAETDRDADPAVFRSDRLTELLTRLGEEKRQLAAASRTYGPRHPSLEAISARIASIEDSVKAERARIVEQAKAEVDVLTEQNTAYEQEIGKRTREQLAAEQKQVVLQDLVRQAQADRQIYEQFLARQKTTQEQSDLAQPEAVVVANAEPPSRSNRPGLKLVGLAGALGGLGLGVLWAMFGSARPIAPSPKGLGGVAEPPPAPEVPGPSAAPSPDPETALVSASAPASPVSPEPSEDPAATTLVPSALASSAPTAEAIDTDLPGAAAVEVATIEPASLEPASNPVAPLLDTVPPSPPAMPEEPSPSEEPAASVPDTRPLPPVAEPSESVPPMPEPAAVDAESPEVAAVATAPFFDATTPVTLEEPGEPRAAVAPVSPPTEPVVSRDTVRADEVAALPSFAIVPSPPTPSPPLSSPPLPSLPAPSEVVAVPATSSSDLEPVGPSSQAAVAPIEDVTRAPPAAADPVTPPPAEEPEVVGEPVRVSARRHDPAQRLRRMLRLLTEHDVPLVADLTRPDGSPEQGLAAFATTLAAHLGQAPGLVLSLVGTDPARPPTAFAEALTHVMAEAGRSVVRRREEAPIAGGTDLVVDVLPPATPTPEIGSHPFTLLVVGTTREEEERLEPLVAIWESDPDRVLVAAFVAEDAATALPT